LIQMICASSEKYNYALLSVIAMHLQRNILTPAAAVERWMIVEYVCAYSYFCFPVHYRSDVFETVRIFGRSPRLHLFDKNIITTKVVNYYYTLNLLLVGLVELFF